MIGLKEVAFYKWVIFDAFVHKAIAEWSLPWFHRILASSLILTPYKSTQRFKITAD